MLHSSRSFLTRLFQLSFITIFLPAGSVQATAQSSFYDEIYGRALRVDDTQPSNQSRRVTLLWMSYLSDPNQPSVLSDLANNQLKNNSNNEQAFQLLSKAFETSHHEYHTGLLLMSLAGYLSHWNRMEEIKNTLLADHPGDPSIMEVLMRAYQMGGKSQEAIEIIHRLYEGDKNNPAYTIQLAGLLNDAQKNDEAESILRDYLANHPTDKLVGQTYTALLMELGRSSEAISRAKELYALYPDDPMISRLFISTLTSAEQYDEVVDLLSRRIDRGGEADKDEFLQLLEIARKSSKEWVPFEEKLYPLLEKLKKRYPSEEEFQTLLMQHYIYLSDTTGLRKEVHSLVDSSIKAYPAYTILLNDYIKMNRIDSVAYVVNKGLIPYPNDPTFLFYDIVEDLMKENADKKAVMKKIDHALEVIPEDSRQYTEITVAKADILEEEGDWKGARPLYEQAVSRGHITASNNLAYFLTRHGTEEDLVYAEKLASIVIQAEPDNATYLDTYAWVLYKRKAYPLAKLYMKKAIEKSPTPDATYWAHYAEILTGAGDYEEAKKAWKKALELGYNGEEVDKGIKVILDLEKGAQN